MSLKEQMQLDAALFLNSSEFGEEVSWFPHGETVALPDPVAIQFQFGQVMINGRIQAVETEASVLVAKASVPDPSKGISFVREDGKEWKVDRTGMRGADAAFWRLDAHLDSLPTLRESW